MSRIIIPAIEETRNNGHMLMRRKRVELRGRLHGRQPKKSDWVYWIDIFAIILCYEDSDDYKLPSDIDLSEFKAILSAQIIGRNSGKDEVRRRNGENVFIIPPGAKNTIYYVNQAKDFFDGFTTWASYANRLLAKVLYITNISFNSKSQISNAANDFQYFLMDFFYSHISIDYAETISQLYERDWKEPFTFRSSGYDYEISHDYIYLISHYFSNSGTSSLATRVWACQILDLDERIESWLLENKQVLETAIEYIYYYHK